jgi:hypothetical protein
MTKSASAQFVTAFSQLVSFSFTAALDGPNVAYFGNPELHYSQVQLVVDELKKMGETPLVTMPSKYVAKRFQLSSGRLQELSTREIQIMDG